MTGKLEKKRSTVLGNRMQIYYLADRVHRRGYFCIQDDDRHFQNG